MTQDRKTVSTITRHARAAGYSPSQVAHGLEWAEAQGYMGARDGFILAMSRILYDDGQLEDGSRFPLEVGSGPQ